MSKVMIIGSGIAGLFAANRLADAGHQVVVVTKQRAKDSSTNWAQGGIAAILDSDDIDAIQAHIEDTLRSGDGACDEAVVRSVTTFMQMSMENFRWPKKEGTPSREFFTRRTQRAERSNGPSSPKPWRIQT